MSRRSYSLIARPHAKPAPGTPLNQHHPAVRSLKFLWPFWEGNPNAAGKGPLPRELLTGAVTSIDAGNGFQWASGPDGLGLHYTGGNTDELGLGLDTNLLPIAPNFTVVFVHRKLDTTLRAHGSWGDSSSTLGTFCGMHWPYNDGQGYFDFGGASSNTSRLIIPAASMPNTRQYEVIVGRVNPFNMALFRNGAKIGQTTGTSVNRSSNPGVNVRIGRHDGQGGNDEQMIYMLAFWHVGLPDELCAALSINPWALFESEMAFRSVFVAATAGDGSSTGTSTVSAISGKTAGVVASSAGAAAVSGSGENAAAFHEGDGTAAGAATVSGVSNPTAASVAASAGSGLASAVGDNAGAITELLPLIWDELQVLRQDLLIQWDEAQLAPLTGGELTLTWLERETLEPLTLTWVELPAGLGDAEELDPQRPYLKIEG